MGLYYDKCHNRSLSLSLSFWRIISSNRSHIVKLPLSRVRNQSSSPSPVSCFPAVLYNVTVHTLCLCPFALADDDMATATEVYAHLPPVPAAEQPSGQRGPFPHCQEALWQHLCLPVSHSIPPLPSPLLSLTHSSQMCFFVFSYYNYLYLIGFRYSEKHQTGVAP